MEAPTMEAPAMEEAPAVEEAAAIEEVAAMKAALLEVVPLETASVEAAVVEWAPMERLWWRQLQWRHSSGDSYHRGTDGIRKQQSTGNNKSSTKNDIWQQQVCLSDTILIFELVAMAKKWQVAVKAALQQHSKQSQML